MFACIYHCVLHRCPIWPPMDQRLTPKITVTLVWNTWETGDIHTYIHLECAAPKRCLKSPKITAQIETFQFMFRPGLLRLKYLSHFTYLLFISFSTFFLPFPFSHFFFNKNFIVLLLKKILCVEMQYSFFPATVQNKLTLFKNATALG